MISIIVNTRGLRGIGNEYYYIDHEGVGFKTERSLESYEKYFGNYLRKHRNQI